MEVNQQEHDRIHDYQVPSHRSQWRSLLQQLLGVEIAHTTTFLDIGHQHRKGGHNHIAVMGGDNCSECFGDSLQAANINWSILCVLIRIGTLFYKTSKAISLAISCILEQIEKTDKKQLSLRFYPDLRSLEIAFVQYLKLKYFQIYHILQICFKIIRCNCGIYEVINDGCGLLFNLET
ncbi:hypothetical protein T05_11958 [Trichinella murrelli]|uniref:Uncharacterized protein n=1 Tax=Trichinella murrelli TaxID=144512 RepID=A0A0V0U937_9BILA|nr:hypothetical protein T05_11958 [Trichinella murrelli]